MRSGFQRSSRTLMFGKRSPANFRFADVASGSDVGCVRAHNEDAVRVNEKAGLLLVADGMGGHAAGEVASRIVADTVESAVVGRGAGLVEALLEANEAVIAAGREGRGAPGMGTTCVACRRVNEGLEVAWVGDSRIYRLRDGKLERLSHDHSYVQTLVDAGLISAEDAEHHPERNVLSLCVGTGQLTEADVGYAVFPLQPGDRVLLCSDGLTGELRDHAIAGLLQIQGDDAAAVAELIDSARQSGGHDNISVIAATV